MKKGAVLSVIAALATAMLTTNPAAAASVCANGDVGSYPPPAATDTPFGITDGPRGTWYSEGDTILRIRGNGQVDQSWGYVVELNFTLVPSSTMALRSLA